MATNIDQRIIVATEQLESDVQKTYEIVNGDENTEVETDGGPVPSHAKVAKDSHDEIIDLLEPTVNDINEHAQYIDGKVTATNENADRAETAVNNAEAIVYEGDATVEPTPGSIPIADANAKIHHGWLPDQSIPYPDFWLPLNDSLKIEAGFGEYDQIDVSEAQDGSVMVDLPSLTANYELETASTYLNKSGVLTDIEENKPRFEKMGILIEPESTNICTNSKGDDSWSSYGGGIKEMRDFIGVDGSSTSLYREQTGTTLGTSSNSTYTLDANTTYTASFWVYLLSEGTRALTIFYDGSELSESTHPIEVGKWVRIQHTYTPTEEKTDVRAIVYMTNGSEGDGFYSGWMQVEALGFASSYIQSIDSPSTRLASYSSFNRVNNIPDGPITVAVVASLTGHNSNDPSDEQVVLEIGDSVNTCRLLLKWRDSGIRYTFGGNNDPVSIYTDELPELNRQYTLVFTLDGKEGELFVDGVSIGKSTSNDSVDFSNIEFCYIGSTLSSRHLSGHVKSVRVFSWILPTEKIASLNGFI